MCPLCGMEKGLHAGDCELLTEAWAELEKPKRRDLARALETKGYLVLFAIGLGVGSEGHTSIKVASHPGVLEMSDRDFTEIRDTVVKALDHLRATPLDDLEVQW